MLEPYLIAHCAPTLASLKTAGLFRLAAVSEPELRQQLADWNALLRQKGLFLLLLRQRGEEALLYLYRASQLESAQITNIQYDISFLSIYLFFNCLIPPS
mgnify:CR=1 FL=1